MGQIRIRLRPYHSTLVIYYFSLGSHPESYNSVGFNEVLEKIKGNPAEASTTSAGSASGASRTRKGPSGEPGTPARAARIRRSWKEFNAPTGGSCRLSAAHSARW